MAGSSAMKLVPAFLVLSLLITRGSGMGHRCARPAPENCSNNPRIRITKNAEVYRLGLCMSGNCLPTSPEEWIECGKVCEMCRSLPGSPGCGNNAACEQEVDAYLNSYCASATLSTTTSGPTVTVTTTQGGMTLTLTDTQTVTNTLTVTQTSSAVSSQCGNAAMTVTGSNSPSAAQSRDHKSVLALGALLALSVLVLLIVTTGWVWTYAAMKRREKVDDDSSQLKFDQKKFFKNPAYEGANLKLSPSHLEDSLSPEQKKFQKNKYDRIVVVPSQQPEGQRYDTLNRKGTLPTQQLDESLQNGNRIDTGGSVKLQYSQLGCRDKEVDNYCVTKLVE